MSFGTDVLLKIENHDDYCRVYEFVKPDESETYPQTDDEYDNVWNYIDTLSEKERRSWMIRHCPRLYVDFSAKSDKQELMWSGRNEMGGRAQDIAEMVVAQFPDIKFKVESFCDLGFDQQFGISDHGKVRWLELSDEVKEMFEWGIDVDPFAGPTAGNYEDLRQHRRKRVQRMIDLGVDITLDTWPPSREQFDEEIRLESAERGSSISERKTDIIDVNGYELPF